MDPEVAGEALEAIQIAADGGNRAAEELADAFGAGGLDVDVDSLRTGYQDLNRLPFTIELFISLLSLFLFIGLRIFQYTARAKDAAALDKLKNLMQTLDTDRDGSVSKLEMRKQYEFYFRPQQPAAATAKGVGSNGESNGGAAAAPAPAKHTQHEMRPFEEFWAQLDVNKDGRITLYELAEHYGVAHLVTPREDESRSASSQPAHLDPQYLEKRLEELHARTKGQAIPLSRRSWWLEQRGQEPPRLGARLHAEAERPRPLFEAVRRRGKDGRFMADARYQECFDSRDYQEGLKAFAEGRDPVFNGS